MRAVMNLQLLGNTTQLVRCNKPCPYTSCISI